MRTVTMHIQEYILIITLLLLCSSSCSFQCCSLHRWWSWLPRLRVASPFPWLYCLWFLFFTVMYSWLVWVLLCWDVSLIQILKLQKISLTACNQRYFRTALVWIMWLHSKHTHTLPGLLHDIYSCLLSFLSILTAKHSFRVYIVLNVFQFE